MKLTTTPVHRRLLALALTATALPLVSAAPTLADSCPNAAVRVGLSARLPECRAYEMVSPIEKSGGEVDNTFTVQSAPSGEAVAYPSPTPLPGAVTGLGANYNLARRTSAGWTSRGVDPPQLNSSSAILTTTEAFSEDLSKSLVISRLALAPGAVEGSGNVYLQDNNTGQRTLMGSSSKRFFFNETVSSAGSLFIGAASDLSTVAIGSEYALTPDAVEGGPNVYEWTSTGGLRLADKMPDGSLGGGAGSGTSYPHTVSTDGRRFFFDGGAPFNGVYVSTDGGTPQLVSGSQQTGADPTVPQQGFFDAASADGSVVFFTSRAQLTDAPANVNYPGGLYRYDVETGKLDDISASISASEFGGSVVGVEQVSSDGSYAYFVGQGDIPGVPGSEEAPRLYLWHNGVTKVVEDLPGLEYNGPISWSMSPDGNWFAFTSINQPTGYDNASPACPGVPAEGIPQACQEVYVYDAASDHLSCISCKPNARPGGFADLGGQFAAVSLYRGHKVFDDGRVFFETTDGLVPADSNGRSDVYEWSNGALTLLSPGVSADGAFLKDVTPDGKNVLFVTRQQLVGQDVDNSIDLYDARVDGGFPAPAESLACTGTGCQGVPSAPPIFATPPSVTFNGVGNFAPQPKAKPKAKPKRKVVKHHKAKKSPKKHARPRSHKSSKSSTRRVGR